MFDEVPAERSIMLECAACKAFNSKNSPAGLVKVKCEGITHEDPDNQTVLQKNVSDEIHLAWPSLTLFSCGISHAAFVVEKSSH